MIKGLLVLNVVLARFRKQTSSGIKCYFADHLDGDLISVAPFQRYFLLFFFLVL